MKKYFTLSQNLTPKIFINASLVFVLSFHLNPEKLSSQCLCNNHDIQHVDVAKQRNYNSSGQMTNWDYYFQFPCLEMPCSNGEFGPEFIYYVLYRPVGATDWILANPDNTTYCGIYIGRFHLKVGNLLPCIEYEFTFTCPCPPQGFNPTCTSEMKLQAFDNGNGIWEGNVATPWIASCSPIDPIITDMQVEDMDFNHGSVRIGWTYSAVPLNSALVEYRPKTSPASSWILLSETFATEFTLTSLTSCMDYDFRVTVPGSCSGSSKQITFKMSDCSAKINDVANITGNTATVSWEPNSMLLPINYTLNWTVPIGNVVASDLSHTITGLLTNANHLAIVTPNCGGSAQCASASQTWSFRTNCDRYEDNNIFEQAAEILLSETIYANFNSIDDQYDFYKFVPTCERINVNTEYRVPNHIYYDPPFLNYDIYDENYNKIPFEPNGESNVYYTVNPGKTYYIKISMPLNFILYPEQWNPDYQNACYNFTVQPCMACFDNELNYIWGDELITSLPYLGLYELNPGFLYSNVNWSIVSGNATLISSFNNPSKTYLYIEQPGEILLSASVNRCDGALMTYYLTINAIDPCYVSGEYTTPQGLKPLKTYNAINTSQYQVMLDLVPNDALFQWALLSGKANAVTNNNIINIHQISTYATFELTLLTPGQCYGKKYIYNFFTPMEAAPDDDEFSIAPNPVSDFLIITSNKFLSKNNYDISNEFEASLFNGYSSEVQKIKGDIYDKTIMEFRDLPSGNYYLRIKHGKFVKTFSIIKT